MPQWAAVRRVIFGFSRPVTAVSATARFLVIVEEVSTLVDNKRRELCTWCRSGRQLLRDFGVGRVARCQRAHDFRERNERMGAFQVRALAVELSGEAGDWPARADEGDAAAVRAIDLHGFNGERTLPAWCRQWR